MGQAVTDERSVAPMVPPFTIRTRASVTFARAVAEISHSTLMPFTTALDGMAKPKSVAFR